MICSFSEIGKYCPSVEGQVVEFVHPTVRLSQREGGMMPMFELLTIVVRTYGREYCIASLDGRWGNEVSPSVAEAEWKNLLFLRKEEEWLQEFLAA